MYPPSIVLVFAPNQSPSETLTPSVSICENQNRIAIYRQFSMFHHQSLVQGPPVYLMTADNTRPRSYSELIVRAACIKALRTVSSSFELERATFKSNCAFS